MIYPYECVNVDCTYKFEVIKSVRSIDAEERCPFCKSVSERRIGKSRLMRVNDWVESYNPAFGCVVKNKAHQREILARRKGETGQDFIEVGTEPVENIHKHFDSKRAEANKKRWNGDPMKDAYETLN